VANDPVNIPQRATRLAEIRLPQRRPDATDGPLGTSSGTICRHRVGHDLHGDERGLLGCAPLKHPLIPIILRMPIMPMIM
jgi:hypothetical protein